MKRIFSLLSAFMVLATGSAFTLVCALVCTGLMPAAEAAVSPCHQQQETEEATSGPGFRALDSACPILAALKARPAIQAPASAFYPQKNAPAPQLLALESEFLAGHPPLVSSLLPGSDPPRPGLPLYLKKRVLRI